MDELADGTYECIVVDVDEDEEDVTRVEFTITAGPHKGETITLRTTSMRRRALSLLGVPATIEVADGAPVVRW